jgi:Fur family ferric uptake transcriptional regulator
MTGSLSPQTPDRPRGAPGRIPGMVVHRNTWQRDRVREALADASGFVSAQTLFATLRDDNTGIGLATVYRALAGLAAQGEADSLQSPEGENLFRACTSPGHHHHLICRSCGLTVEIAANDVEQWAQKTAAAHGFTQAEHVVDIFGLCAACAAERATTRVAD